MPHEHYEDLLTAYALGELTGEDLQALESHLDAGCDLCRRMLPKLMESAAALSSTLPARTPPPEIKARVFAQIESFSPRGGRIPRWAYLAAASVIVTIGVWTWRTTPPVAQVVFAPEAVTLDGRPAAPQAFIRPKQVLATSGVAGAIARLAGDAASVYLMDHTRVKMPESADGAHRRLRLSAGRLLSLVRPGYPFSVETPLGEIAARGTTFFVKIDSAERMYVCICDGRIDVTSGGSTHTMEAVHHAAAEIIARDGRREFVPAAMRDHTDTDVAFLERHHKK